MKKIIPFLLMLQNPNFSNRISNERSHSMDKDDIRIHKILHPPLSQNSQRGRTYCVLKPTEVINLHFDAKLHGSLIILKSGSIGNKFAIKSILDTYNTVCSLRKMYSQYLWKKQQTFCVLRRVGLIAFLCEYNFFEAELTAKEWILKSKRINQFFVEFYKRSDG